MRQPSGEEEEQFNWPVDLQKIEGTYNVEENRINFMFRCARCGDNLIVHIGKEYARWMWEKLK